MKKFKLSMTLDGAGDAEEWGTFEEFNMTDTSEEEYNAMTPEQQYEWRYEVARERVMELLSYCMEEVTE